MLRGERNTWIQNFAVNFLITSLKGSTIRSIISMLLHPLRLNSICNFFFNWYYRYFSFFVKEAFIAFAACSVNRYKRKCSFGLNGIRSYRGLIFFFYFLLNCFFSVVFNPFKASVYFQNSPFFLRKISKWFLFFTLLSSSDGNKAFLTLLWPKLKFPLSQLIFMVLLLWVNEIRFRGCKVKPGVLR